MHQPEPSNTRTIVLADLQGQELKLVLWGDRAVEFEEEAVRARDEKQVVIAIFVGTLPKINQGVIGLSGSSACRWYIDEDLPVINDFCNRLGNNFKPIDNNGALVESVFPTRVYADPVQMTVSELLQLNPYENEEKRFICNVTVERLNPDQRWWFFSCSTCNKTSTILASQYRCTNPGCLTITTQETYYLSVFARDDVAEAEFIMFDKVGKAVVGKPLLTLLKFRNPGLLTIQEIARVPMVDKIAPPEVMKIVDSPIPSEMFTPNTPSIQQAQPGSSLGSLAIGYQTPTCAARTPTSKLNVGLLSSASPGKSPCPASARRVLFLADEKKTTLAEEPMKKSADAAEENYDDKAEDPSSGTKGKDDKTHVTKNKRSSAAGKGPAAGKKTRQ